MSQAVVDRAALAARHLAEVRGELEAFRAALTRHAHRLPDPTPALALAQRIAGELAKPAPDRSMLKGLLTLIVEETRVVAEIAGAASALRGLVDVAL